MGPRRFSSCVLLSACVLGAAPQARAARPNREAAAEARTLRSDARPARIVWTEISLPVGEKRPDLERFLKQLIDQQSNLANWGIRRDSPVEARFMVTQFSVVSTNRVVRVTCTAVGQLKGGQVARSHFSMGGRPAQRAELERQLLTMLGRGIVSRLAEIARARR